MRKSITLAVALTIALGVASPTYAAKRQAAPQQPGVMQQVRDGASDLYELVKRTIKRTFGVVGNTDRPVYPLP